MSAEAFVDTNVLLYAAAGKLRYPDKHKRAWDIMDAGNYAISGQVLAEFYVNATTARKDKPAPMKVGEAVIWIENLSTVPVIPVDQFVFQQGVNYSQRYQISYWDAALVAAAEVIGASVLYSEDLNHGQTYGSVKVINPFKVN